MIERGVLNLHLSSGEDIVGSVKESQTTYFVDNPRRPQLVQMGPNQTPQIGLGPLAPWLSECKTIEIPVAQVVFVHPPDLRMTEAYKKLTSRVQIASMAEMPRTLN